MKRTGAHLGTRSLPRKARFGGASTAAAPPSPLRLAVLLLFLLPTLCCLGTVKATASPTPAAIALADITLIADFYPPPGDSGGVPGVLLLHGWNFPHLTPASAMGRVADAFRKAGYAVLVPNLRGWPPTGGVDDCAGRQVEDVLQALAWLGDRPGVDGGRLYLVGYSQGAQIALLAGARGARVLAIAAFAPVTDVGRWGEGNPYPGIRDYVQAECGGPAGWPERSPLAVASDLDRPLLLVHGDADRRVPTAQSLALYRHLVRMQRHVRLELLAGTGHALDDVLEPALAIGFFRELEAAAAATTPSRMRR